MKKSANFLINSTDHFSEVINDIVFGYFGDYYSFVKNLRPFYEASVELKAKVRIYGDSNEKFPKTKKMTISRRVDKEFLTKIQENTDVLVLLCNVKGGKIPGKIEHFLDSDKPVIFIVDGKEEEKSLIKDYFGKFERFHLCENKKESIMEVMSSFINGDKLRSSFIFEDTKTSHSSADFIK